MMMTTVSSFSSEGLKGFAESRKDDYPLSAKGNMSSWAALLATEDTLFQEGKSCLQLH